MGRNNREGGGGKCPNFLMCNQKCGRSWRDCLVMVSEDASDPALPPRRRNRLIRKIRDEVVIVATDVSSILRRGGTMEERLVKMNRSRIAFEQFSRDLMDVDPDG